MVKEVKRWTDSEVNATILSTADEVRRTEEAKHDKEIDRLLSEASDDSRIWKLVGAAAGAFGLGALFVISQSSKMPVDEVTISIWTGLPLFIVGTFVLWCAFRFINKREKTTFSTKGGR